MTASAGLPTVKDVARAAGVSPMTVSRVVNGTGNVDPRRREAVESAVSRLGYRRNSAARTLRGVVSRTWTVGCVVDDIKDPFSSRLTRALEDALAPHGSMLLVASSDAHAERAADIVGDLVTRDVDALVVAPPPGDQGYLSPEATRGRPVVCVDRPAAVSTIPTLLSDNREGARRATEHLIAQGHRRIAVIADDRGYAMQERLAGYADALHDEGLEERSELIRRDAYVAADVPGIVSDLLESDAPPTALFTARDVASLGALIGLHQMGKQHVVAQVGFDDVDFGTIVDPALTVISQRLERMGTRTVQWLMQALEDGERPGPGDTVRVPVDLIERGSGEIPPTDHG